MSFFYGVLATEMKRVAKGKNAVTVAELAQIFEATGPPMNGAAMNPQEGTMLSVARDSVAGLSQPPPTSLVDLLGRWVKKANVELAKTPDQLIVNGRKVLAGKGVVDSGAKGFVVMVEGMLLVAQGKLEYKVLEAAGLADEGDVAMKTDHDDTDDIETFPYCTEVMLKLRTPPYGGHGDAEALANERFKALKTKLREAEDQQGIGDSTVAVIAPAKKVRVCLPFPISLILLGLFSLRSLCAAIIYKGRTPRQGTALPDFVANDRRCC